VSAPQETLDRWTDGERLFATALGRLTDEELDGPSLLPGWDRRHVLAHVARNADAVLNLLTWARTGEETPMYPSPEAREAGIAETAALDPSRLRTELVAATARFADAVRGMPEAAWSAQVRTMQGRTVPAAEVPWMRCIEVVVHAVDLDAGVGFADVDEQVQAAICDAVFGSWERRGETPDVVVFAGDREWGAKMQDDLVDAVNWAVEEGVANKERVAIYGGSYGGYAALAGATFTPELFRCAVDIVGPSSLVTLIESIPPYWKPLVSTFHERVGNPETEREFLDSRSPLFFVDRISIPMLIAQGANDPRVKQAESEQIVAAMQEKGIDHEYLLFEDEGHGFARPENRLTFYAATERFLAKHLGGRVEE